MARLDLSTADYDAAERLLNGRDSRRIGHNTTLHRHYSGADLAVRYHATDIVSMAADGWVTINTAGYWTVTTLQRINYLLPGRWRLGTDGKRGSYLWHGGHAITPYVDGIAINDAAGSVGLNGDTLLTAADVAAIENAADVAAQVRAEKRAARLLREHPTAFGPREHRANLRYGGRPSGCDRCAEELRAERAARDATLRSEHAAMVATLGRNPTDADPWTDAEYAAAGSHIARSPMLDWPTDPATGRADYTAEPTRYERVEVRCPWSCPDRVW